MSRDESRYVITLPRPLANQKPILDSPARFKGVRAGRRFGKSRLGLSAAVLGHGPRAEKNRPKFPGIIHGAQGVWLTPDFPQSRAIWEEEIVPRFENKAHCRLLKGERALRVGHGKLSLRSAANIDSIRGQKLDFAIVDEAAFLDLAYARDRVLRYTLADRQGWEIVIGTTKIGSEFNRMMTEIAADVERRAKGEPEKFPGWEGFRGMTKDNPKLPPEEIALMYAEFPPGSTDAAEELEAELLEAYGTLFQRDYFKFYRSADRNAMYIGEYRHNFEEIHIYCDLAATVKQTSDYTAMMVAGLTHGTPGDPKKAGVLEVVNKQLEGPAQIDEMERMIDRWQPDVFGIEAVGYQITAVQHLIARLEMRDRPVRTEIKPIQVDKDKRARAVPMAAAMARGDVWWPENASFMLDLIPQYLKFPHGKPASIHVDEHDDMVDTGSMLATNLSRIAIVGTTWQPFHVSTL